MLFKKDDINVFFILIFIQIDISSKFKSHMQLQTILCDYKSFLPSVAEDNRIYNHKNGWFGYKLQMHGSERTWILVVKLDEE
jgi:hypothetical protein